MTKDEYKRKKKETGLNLSDWLKLIEIENDTHKSYSCGRREIPPRKARYIKEVVKEFLRQKKLKQKKISKK